MSKQEQFQNQWIRTGDKVVVRKGNDRGKTGTVISRTNDRCLVQGLNLKHKAVRPSESNPKGGFAEIEAPIHASNLCLVTDDDKRIKVKSRTNKSGERELVFSEGKKEVVYRPVKKAK